MTASLRIGLFALCALGGCSAPGVSGEDGMSVLRGVSTGSTVDTAEARAGPASLTRSPVAHAVPWPEHVPLADTLPDDRYGAQVRRGHAILIATRDSLPNYVGNQLRCTSCHLDDGRRANALPWVGVMARFPQYRARNAKVNLIEDRVNDCIERSLAGRALPNDHAAMRDIVTYFTFLSRGVPAGRRIVGQGAPPLTAQTANTTRGAAVYARDCSRCHGEAGEGTALSTPVWGEHSYSNGAGMGRVRTAAAFIAANMPYDGPGLDPQDALDVAAYINMQPRPAFARAAADWPFGGAPVDVPYATAGRTPANQQLATKKPLPPQ